MQSVRLQFEQHNDYRTREAFKTLRTNIEFCGDVKVLEVTSCTPNEGKSSVAMEMAKTFAEAGNRTMLIDADMRKSVLVGRYKTGAVRMGLTHSLAGIANYTDVMCETNILGLYVIFSGPVPPNPSELLGREKFASMIRKLKEAFDYVIIDTPPLGSVIDAAVVAKNCDGVVLVIENNAISYKFAQRVKDQLDKAESRILGVVLNKVDMTGKGYYGHYGKYYGKYYGRYYGRYGEDSIENKAAGAIPRPFREDIIVETTRKDSAAQTTVEVSEKKTEIKSSEETGSDIEYLDDI